MHAHTHTQGGHSVGSLTVQRYCHVATNGSIPEEDLNALNSVMCMACVASCSGIKQVEHLEVMEHLSYCPRINPAATKEQIWPVPEMSQVFIALC